MTLKTLSRRHFLGFLTALPAGVVVGCSAAGSTIVPTRGSTTPSVHAPSRATAEVVTDPTTPEEALPPVPQHPPLAAEASQWVPENREVSPEIKRIAAAFLETAGNWENGTGAVAALLAAGARDGSAPTAGVLDVPGATSSTLRLVYPQYGGLEGDFAAIIALFDQECLLANGEVTARQIALDLRLSRDPSGEWGVNRINPLTSLGASLPLTATAQDVLTSPRIQLSGPAALDVGTGRMNDGLLRILLGLARDHTIGVQVMHTGHIQTVFPHDRTSNHAVGRAVDIREIDGFHVISEAMPRDVLTHFMQSAAYLGATEVGGPFDLNGEGRQGFFSDPVHQDHVHIGITPGLAQAHLR